MFEKDIHFSRNYIIQTRGFFNLNNERTNLNIFQLNKINLKKDKF